MYCSIVVTDKAIADITDQGICGTPLMHVEEKDWQVSSNLCCDIQKAKCACKAGIRTLTSMQECRAKSIVL